MEEEFSFVTSNEDREMMKDFIAMVAEFLKDRFPVTSNTPKRQRQKVQAADGIVPNNDTTTTS